MNLPLDGFHTIGYVKHTTVFAVLTDNENPMGENDALVLSAQNILMQPETLVGQRIRHQFEVDGDLSWYDGTVLKMNAKTKEFEVIYDGEEETCWFPLLEDLSTGDLLVAST